MSDTILTFAAAATEKVAEGLIKAAAEVPVDKRYWQPLDKGRSVANQMAEIAILNGYSAQLLQTHEWVWNDFTEYFRVKDKLSQDWDKIHALLKENTQKLVEAIRNVREDQLSIEIPMMGAKRTIAELIMYPYWNMSYHEGQINYIHFLAE